MAEIYTSYFAKLDKLPDDFCPISICGKAPDSYTGAKYKALAPKYWFFKKYKEDGDEEFYTLAFNRDVTGVLKPYEVFLDLQELRAIKHLAYYAMKSQVTSVIGILSQNGYKKH